MKEMPVKVNIKETNLDFGELSERRYTDMIIIHHTGSTVDRDFTAAQIHDIHLNKGWSGIGYHFVVTKGGIIERGRPIWAVGAHAGENGMNSHSIGIHLSGDFNAGQPTGIQIEMTSMLIAYLCEKYNIPTDRQHIKGHREVGSTDCPGRNLFALMDILSGKANYYRYGEPVKNESSAPIPDAVVANANKRKIEVRSQYPISDDDIKRIVDIFHESQCPNESMFISICHFASYDGNQVVYIGDHPDEYVTQIEL